MNGVERRARVGMVFKKPNPVTKSIYDNVAYGPRIHGLATGKADLDAIVERALVRAGLWDEVKDRLGESGTALSGGQQQRLCIARAIAVDPEVIRSEERRVGKVGVSTCRSWGVPDIETKKKHVFAYSEELQYSIFYFYIT